MGLLDKIKAMLGGNADKIKGGVDKAGDVIDDKTGGKYTDKIEKAEDKIADVVDGQTEEDKIADVVDGQTEEGA